MTIPLGLLAIVLAGLVVWQTTRLLDSPSPSHPAEKGAESGSGVGSRSVRSSRLGVVAAKEERFRVSKDLAMRSAGRIRGVTHVGLSASNDLIKALRLTADEIATVNEILRSSFEEIKQLKLSAVVKQKDDLGRDVWETPAQPEKIADILERFGQDLQGELGDERGEFARKALENSDYFGRRADGVRIFFTWSSSDDIWTPAVTIIRGSRGSTMSVQALEAIGNEIDRNASLDRYVAQYLYLVGDLDGVRRTVDEMKQLPQETRDDEVKKIRTWYWKGKDL